MSSNGNVNNKFSSLILDFLEGDRNTFSSVINYVGAVELIKIRYKSDHLRLERSFNYRQLLSKVSVSFQPATSEDV